MSIDPFQVLGVYNWAGKCLGFSPQDSVTYRISTLRVIWSLIVSLGLTPGYHYLSGYLARYNGPFTLDTQIHTKAHIFAVVSLSIVISLNLYSKCRYFRCTLEELMETAQEIRSHRIPLVFHLRYHFCKALLNVLNFLLYYYRIWLANDCHFDIIQNIIQPTVKNLPLFLYTLLLLEFSLFLIILQAFFEGISTSNADLFSLRKIHGRLVIVSEQINSMYSASLLLLLTSSFVWSVSGAYFVTFSRAAGGWWDLWSGCLHVITNMTNVFYLTYECQKIGAAANKFNKKLYEEDLNASGANYDIKWYLRNNKVVFTAVNFFRLDNSHFQSMLAAVCMYVIIIIQFARSGDC